MTYITWALGWACDNRCSEKFLTHQEILIINKKVRLEKKTNTWPISDSNVTTAVRIFTKYRDTERKFFRSFQKFYYFISEPRFEFSKPNFLPLQIFYAWPPLWPISRSTASLKWALMSLYFVISVSPRKSDPGRGYSSIIQFYFYRAPE